ncbi:MAG: hypothetical protein A4E32_00977 [Methanomassiliicoccales archaeon PtaU1.Bin124]|nr:MAG: hypothetical protein A4E32_00977 [Methanomassiliicoccales archaeon PtaU1.Bin124]
MSLTPDLIRANMSLEEIETHDHVALFYADDDERDRQSARLCSIGYERGEQIVLLATPDVLEGLRRHLTIPGRSLAELEAGGNLRAVLFDEGESYDEEKALLLLEKLVHDGVAKGFPAVRIITYASSLARWWDMKALLRIESLCNEIFEETAAVSVCLWQANEPMVMSVVARHPFLVVRGFLCSNYFYMAPADVAKDERAIPVGPAFLDRLLDIQMNELSLKQQDERMKEVNCRLADEMEQRQKVEWALVLSENNYRNALNAMADMVHVIDREGKVVLANHVFIDKVKQLGYPGNVIGDRLSDMLPYLCQENLEDNERVFNTGCSLKKEEMVRIAGHDICIEVRKIPVMNGPSAYNVLTIAREVEQR